MDNALSKGEWPAASRDDLKAEYVLIQGQYEAFDQRALSIKSVAIPLLGAGLAVGSDKHMPALLLVTGLAALSLWMLETIWKSFQYCYVTRIKALEEWFRTGEPNTMAPFQIYFQWVAEWAVRRQPLAMVRVFFEPFVALPYAIIVAASFAATVFYSAPNNPVSA